MTSRHHSFIRRHTLILGIVLGTASLLAQAQTGSSTAPVPGGQASQGMHQDHHEGGKNAVHSGTMHDRMQARQARQAKHLQELKAKLQLAPTQDAAWAGFTGVLQARLSHTPPPGAGPDMAQLNTPERLDRMRAMRAQHQTEMNAFVDRRADATRALYAALTPEQQKIFDAEIARMMQARGHGHGMHSAGGRG